MNLQKISCTGLQGFEEFELENINKINVLVGPNGTGKSTALRVISLALDILQKRTFEGDLPQHDPWDRFSIARLTFSAENNAALRDQYWPQLSSTVEFTIECSEEIFFITQITMGTTVKFDSRATIESLNSLENHIKKTTKTIEELRTKLQNSNQPSQRQQNQSNIELNEKNLKSSHRNLKNYR